MEGLLPSSEKIKSLLKARRETIAIAESSTGGLISAALLAMPGASAYFVGGVVVYTRTARASLLGITDTDMTGMRASTEPYALICAKAMRERCGSTWALAETGAAGPTGNRYGDAAGHSCIAMVGPSIERAITLETGSADRQANMRAFAARAFELFLEAAVK